MLKVQDKPFTNIEDITKINMVTQNVVVCTSLPAGINLCGHSADCVVGLDQQDVCPLHFLFMGLNTHTCVVGS